MKQFKGDEEIKEEEGPIGGGGSNPDPDKDKTGG